MYVSNLHRVISTPGQSRHSIAAFYHLDHDTPIRSIIPTGFVDGMSNPDGENESPTEVAKYEEIRYIDYLVSRFNAVQQLGVTQEKALQKVGHVTPPDCQPKM